MSQRNTVVRSMHDLGLAAWFGGSLMGVIGLNGATAKADDPSERLRLSSLGWGRWAPVQLTALALHAVGGLGLIAGNKDRLVKQQESRQNTSAKSVITIAAAGVSLYSAILGVIIGRHADEGGNGVTEPSAAASAKLARAQKRQKVAQWIIPALTAVVVVLAAQQGEQQRPLAGFGHTTARSLRKAAGK